MKEKILIKTDVKSYPKQDVVILKLDQQTVPDIALMLMLLKKDFVNRIDLKLIDFRISFSLNSENESKCISNGIAAKSLDLAISANALEYMLNFLLRYYRDNSGESEHIDVDFKFKEDYEITLTLKVDIFKQISEDELNRLLEL